MRSNILNALLIFLATQSVVLAKANNHSVPKQPRVNAITDAQSDKIAKETHLRAATFIANARKAYTAHPPQFDKAILNYKEALKIEDNPFTRLSLAQMLKFSQRYSEAEAEYEKVRGYYRDHPSAPRSFAIGAPKQIKN